MSIGGEGPKFNPRGVNPQTGDVQSKTNKESLKDDKVKNVALNVMDNQSPSDNKSSLFGRLFKYVINSSTKILKNLTAFGSDVNNAKGVEESGLKVIASLEEGLRTLTPGEISPPTPKNALKVFQAFANAVSESGLKVTDHVAIYGQLAACYFDLAEQSFNIDDLYNEKKLSFEEAEIETNLRRQFINEITIRENNGDCSFEWFSLYCDRLTILMTEPALRTSPLYTFNVEFEQYRTKLAKGDWRSHEGYIGTCESVGGKDVSAKVSPLARSRVDYPDVIMLPYPFELDAKQIFDTTPGLRGNHFWPLGYVLRTCPGDGGPMSPLVFIGHDDFHFRNFNFVLNQRGTYYAVSKKTATPPSNELLKMHVMQGKELHLRSLEVIAKVLESGNRSSDRKKMDNFFAFQYSHENMTPLQALLSGLIGGESYCYMPFFDYDEVKIEKCRDEKFYRSSLPSTMQDKLEDKTAFGELYEAYALKFLEDFQAKLEEYDPDLRKALLKWIDFYQFADIEQSQNKRIGLVFLSTIDLNLYTNHELYPIKLPLPRSWGAYWINAAGETLTMLTDHDIQTVRTLEFHLNQQGIFEGYQAKFSESEKAKISPTYSEVRGRSKFMVSHNKSKVSQYLIGLFPSNSPEDAIFLALDKLYFAKVFNKHNGDHLDIYHYLLEKHIK